MKICVVEFYMRLTGDLKPHSIWLRLFWWLLVATFVGVVLTTLLECHPFSEQVPSPPPLPGRSRR